MTMRLISWWATLYVYRKPIVICVSLSVFFFLVGLTAPQRHDVRVEKKEVIVVKTKDVPGKTVMVPLVTESCKRMLSLAARRANAAEMIDASSAAQLDIISKARQAVAEGNSAMLNDLDTKQRQLQGQTIHWVLEMSTTKDEYTLAKQLCDKETR